MSPALTAAAGPRTDARWTPALVRQAERYALWRHHRNLDAYRAVMSGRP